MLSDAYSVDWNTAGGSDLAKTWLGHFGEQSVSNLGIEIVDLKGQNDSHYGVFAWVLKVMMPWCPPEHCVGDDIQKIEHQIQVHDEGVLADVHTHGSVNLDPYIQIEFEPDN